MEFASTAQTRRWCPWPKSSLKTGSGYWVRRGKLLGGGTSQRMGEDAQLVPPSYLINGRRPLNYGVHGVVGTSVGSICSI